MGLDELNLDAMSQADLMAFWGKYHRCSRKAAAELIGPRKGVTRVVWTLANYACNKAVAMGCRVKGDIPGALCYEHAADLSYERLPEDCRW